MEHRINIHCPGAIYSIALFIGTALPISFLAGCSTLMGGSRSSFEASERSRVTIEGYPVTVVEKGVPFFIDDAPALVESPGFISVLLLPRPSRGSTKLELKSHSSLSDEAIGGKANRQINEIILELSAIQVLLGSGRGAEALGLVEALEKKFPRVTSILFVKASCLLVARRQAEARSVLEIALRDFPENTSARLLLQRLGQESSSGR